MKQFFIATVFAFFQLLQADAQPTTAGQEAVTPRLYLDIHYLPGSNTKFEDVAAAHSKDLAVQAKHDVQFLKYWVDEKNSVVYCLSLAKDTGSIRKTHAEAHGLLPQEMYAVTTGTEAEVKGRQPLFFDVHRLGVRKATAADVAKAHEKDLAVQQKHGVNCVNYWVAEKEGVVFCLAQAATTADMLQTHKEAHGLLPTSIAKVKQGQ